MVIKYIKILILTLLLVSCRAKTIYVETHTVDTLKVNTVLKVTPPSLNQIVVDNPCDSLGNIKPISYTIKTAKTKLKVETTADNKLIISEETDEIVEKIVETEKIHSDSTNKKVVIFKPPKWAWYSLIFNVLLLIYLFRKFIPIVNKI